MIHFPLYKPWIGILIHWIEKVQCNIFLSKRRCCQISWKLSKHSVNPDIIKGRLRQEYAQETKAGSWIVWPAYWIKRSHVAESITLVIWNKQNEAAKTTFCWGKWKKHTIFEDYFFSSDYSCFIVRNKSYCCWIFLTIFLTIFDFYNKVNIFSFPFARSSDTLEKYILDIINSVNTFLSYILNFKCLCFIICH